MEEHSTSPWLRAPLSDWAPLLQQRYLIEVKKDHTFFTQGDPAAHLYVVRRGRVLLSCLSRDGSVKILMFAGTGGLFGEGSLFDGLPYSYGARTVVDCSLYKIPYAELHALLENDPAFCLRILRLLCAKERILAAQIEALAFDDAYHRIVSELLYSAVTYGVPVEGGTLIELPITQQDLGNRVQATRVTVSKTLRELTREGILAKRGRYYLIRDMDALRRIRDSF